MLTKFPFPHSQPSEATLHQQKGFQIKWLVFIEEEENEWPEMILLGSTDNKDLISWSQMYSSCDFSTVLGVTDAYSGWVVVY